MTRKTIYGENWQQFEERTSLERAHQKLMDAEAERKKQQRVNPTKQPTLRCCYNCMYSKEVEYEGTLVCSFPLVDTCVEPTDMCAYIVVRGD